MYFYEMLAIDCMIIDISLVRKTECVAHNTKCKFKPQDQPGALNTDADVILRNVKLPLVGDLLGRERVSGAKKTRLGCDSPSERFQNIVEVPALWHTKQSFLGVSKITSFF